MTLLCLQGCGAKEEEISVGGKIYTYTGETPFEFESDAFIITINENGTFTYHTSLLSSYLGYGQWTLEGDVLTLTEDPDVCYPYVHYFKVDGDDLIFIEEGSDNFMHITVKDGERFTGVENAEH